MTRISARDLNIPPVSRKLAEDLIHRIHAGELKPDDRLAGTRELARQYGISYVSATKALEELAEEGLIRRVSGQGTFVNDPSLPRPIRHVEFVALGQSEGNPVVGRMMQAMCEKLGNSTISLQFDPITDVEGVIAATKGWQRRGVVIFGRINADLLAAMRHRVRALVAVGVVEHEVPGVSRIAFELDVTAFRATRRLLREGHDRIWLAPYERQPFNNAMLVAGYVGAMGHRAESPSSEPIDGPSRPQQVAWILSQVRQARRPAILCAYRTVAESVLEMATRQGLRVPQDLSIVSIGGNLVTGQPFATWEAPAEICGREAAQMILDAAQGLPPRTVTLANQYIPGFSVLPAT